MSFEKNNNTPWTLDTKKLLDNLHDNISSKYWIDKSSAEILIKWNSIKNITYLKKELYNSEIGTQNEKLSDSKLEKLFFTISWAKELIEQSSKSELNAIKNEIENTAPFQEYTNQLESVLPSQIVDDAKNPKNLHHHILWASLWVSNSIIKTADILYQIWKGILKTPYDLYLIISWKWEYNWFKNI